MGFRDEGCEAKRRERGDQDLRGFAVSGGPCLHPLLEDDSQRLSQSQDRRDRCRVMVAAVAAEVACKQRDV